MSLPAIPRLPLSGGNSIPQLGFGTWKIPDEDAAGAVRTALELGYRHLDTASLYANERGVGQGLRESGIVREEVFITSKAWNDQQGRERLGVALRESLERLGLEWLDLYLIHWPAPRQDRYAETWAALRELRDAGLVRSIGVSNFQSHHLQRVYDETSEWPAINQIELHPWLPQTPLREFHAARGILTQAWAPLARGRVVEDPVIEGIAQDHQVTPGQVVLRWHIQLGNVVIPKSVHRERIAANAELFGFELTPDQMAAINGLETGERTGNHPDEWE